MIVFLLGALLAARRRGCALRPLLRAAPLWPLFAVELVHMGFVLAAFCGDYRFVPYGAALQTAFLLALLPPVLVYRLYRPALLGAGLCLAGTVLNRLVMAANGGRMPVLPTLSRLTGYYREGLLEQGLDSVHIAMGPAVRLGFLGDWIDLGFVILSPGDVLIHLFVSIILYASAQALTKREKKG